MLALDTPARITICEDLTDVLTNRKLIIASNRGPMSILKNGEGNYEFQKGSGGLVTALIGLAQHIDASWVASALNDLEREWHSGEVQLNEQGDSIHVELLDIHPTIFHGYYNLISNPLLWFLQHSMWDFVRSPTITREIWDAWENGYVEVNRLFAHAINNLIVKSSTKSLVMLQDYHLYLTPKFIRQYAHPRTKYSLLHFVHIPWPGPEDWGILPPSMRQRILEGLCNVDLLGFQTREDGLNFVRTCESHLPGAKIFYNSGKIIYNHRVTHIRDFPISIDVEALRDASKSEAVSNHRNRIQNMARGRKLIVRVDRTEPSKNIVRGFEAYGDMLEYYPEHIENVLFLTILVPSRLEVDEYQSYLDEIMAAAGRVNARYGTSDWEPIRVLVGEDYNRAIAGLQLYDVLLVNAIADGMNLVAKEGPIVNEKNGVLVLSERVGAHQQLGGGALVVAPCDVYATAETLHQALVMPEPVKTEWAQNLIASIEKEDINEWFCKQINTVAELKI